MKNKFLLLTLLLALLFATPVFSAAPDPKGAFGFSWDDSAEAVKTKALSLKLNLLDDRTDKAKGDRLSNAKISAIAKEVGFTTTEYYKKHFKFWYGKTPDEYRKEYLSKPANVIDNVNTTILNSSDLGAALNTELSHDFGLITDSIKYRCQFVNVDVSNNHVTKPKHLLPNLSCPLDMVINNSEEVVMALKDLNAKKLSITSKVPLSILPPEIDRVRRLGVTLKYETSKSGKTQKNYTFDTCYKIGRAHV